MPHDYGANASAYCRPLQVLARQKKAKHKKSLALVSKYKRIQETYSRKMQRKEQDLLRKTKKGLNARLEGEQPMPFTSGRRTAGRRHTDAVNSEAEFAEIMFELAAQESQVRKPLQVLPNAPMVAAKQSPSPPLICQGAESLSADAREGSFDVGQAGTGHGAFL